MKFIGVAALLFFLSFPALSESQFNENTFTGAKKSSAIGVTVGSLSGIGVSYRKFLDNNFGFQVSGGIAGSSSVFYADIAANALYRIVEHDEFMIYGVSGVSLFDSANEHPSWKHTLYMTVGVGLGIEYFLSENLALDFSVPMQASFYVSEEEKFTFYHFWPIPSVGIYYHF